MLSLIIYLYISKITTVDPELQNDCNNLQYATRRSCSSGSDNLTDCEVKTLRANSQGTRTEEHTHNTVYLMKYNSGAVCQNPPQRIWKSAQSRGHPPNSANRLQTFAAAVRTEASSIDPLPTLTGLQRAWTRVPQHLPKLKALKGAIQRAELPASTSPAPQGSLHRGFTLYWKQYSFLINGAIFVAILHETPITCTVWKLSIVEKIK